MSGSNAHAKEMLTVRITKTVRDKLLSLAESTGRSQTYIVEEALEAFCDLNEWQIEAINEGIKSADEGRLIPHETLKRKWEQKLENIMD